MEFAKSSGCGAIRFR